MRPLPRDRAGEVTRYVLSVVYRDGVPQELKRYDALPEALKARDGLRIPSRRGVEHFMVHDSDDEELGYLDWPEDAA